MWRTYHTFLRQGKMAFLPLLTVYLSVFELTGSGNGAAASMSALRTKAMFANGLFDSVPVGAQDAMKAIMGSEHYALIQMESDALSAWEKKDIENIGGENEEEAKKSALSQVQKCERHPHVSKGPCWNTCRDPIIRVERHRSQPINPKGNGGPNRIERVFAVICPWHIRGHKDRVPFNKNNVTIVRNRGQLSRSASIDDAAHLIASVLGGLPDIDSNAFPQTTMADQPAHIRRSELHIQQFLLQQCRCPGGGGRMVMYDIMLHYDDTSETLTRPDFLHYVGSFYKWQEDKKFKLLEISTEVQDNAPHINYADSDGDNLALVGIKEKVLRLSHSLSTSATVTAEVVTECLSILLSSVQSQRGRRRTAGKTQRRAKSIAFWGVVAAALISIILPALCKTSCLYQRSISFSKFRTASTHSEKPVKHRGRATTHGRIPYFIVLPTVMIDKTWIEYVEGQFDVDLRITRTKQNYVLVSFVGSRKDIRAAKEYLQNRLLYLNLKKGRSVSS